MKKGIIFTVIILIVAAVLTVVFVTLFKERDTDAVANKVISVVDEGYLSENSDKEALEDYLDYMSASEQNDEVTMSKTLLATYDKLGDFYREHIAFTSYNSTYKSNKGDIINGLDSASDSMDEMVIKEPLAIKFAESPRISNCAGVPPYSSSAALFIKNAASKVLTITPAKDLAAAAFPRSC